MKCHNFDTAAEKTETAVRGEPYKRSASYEHVVCTGQTVINGESLPHVVSGVHPYSGIGKFHQFQHYLS